jgi:imidazolonepropionase-like amidohydrolase
MHQQRSSNSGRFLFGLVALTVILAWITYGTLPGVLGAFSYLLVGLVGVLPWIIPLVGVPLGILDLLGTFGGGIYAATLDLARVESTWLTLLWYALVVVFASLVSLALSLRVIRSIFRKRPLPRNLALVNVHVIDGRRDSQVLHDGVILIKNVVDPGEEPGRIVAVGPADEVTIPEDYEQIDLAGQWVLPGFINAHCHLFGSGKPMRLFRLLSENESLAARLVGWLASPLGKRLVMRMMIGNVTNALHSGVTTLRSMGDLAYLDVALRKKIQRGEVLGPRLLVCGQGICPTGGHGGLLGSTADSDADIKRLVRTNIREEVDWIKILSTGGVMDARRVGEAGQPQMTVDEIGTACTHTHRAGVMVASHCESTQGIAEALLGGVDTIEHGADITDELVPLFKNNPKALRGYTALVPTLSAGMGLSTLPAEVTQISPMAYQNAGIIERGMIKGLRRAVAEGIPIAVGTDAAVPYVLRRRSTWRPRAMPRSWGSGSRRAASRWANQPTCRYWRKIRSNRSTIWGR